MLLPIARPTDDCTADGEPVLRSAARLADAFGADLTIVTVADPWKEGEEEALRARLVDHWHRSLDAADAADAASDESPQARALSVRIQDAVDLNVTYDARPFHGVLVHAAAVEADLIVLGSHSGSEVAARWRGTTAERVVRSSDVPCLVVTREVHLPIRHAGVATDFTPSARGSALLALDWIPTLGGLEAAAARPTVSLVHVSAAGEANGGEIAVLAIAALGAFVVLKLGRTARPMGRAAAASSVVLQAGARLLLALLLVTSLFMLWRGHNEPGGGFTGGLFAASAVVLYLMAFRQEQTERLLRVPPRVALGAGLAVAVVSGLVGWGLSGASFLTGQWVSVGGLKRGTPLLFDIGVFLVVVGFTLTIVLAERSAAELLDTSAYVQAVLGEPATPPAAEAW